MTLYYGCRHPEHDYIYEDELKKFIQDGVLSELHTAFSRVTAKKVSLHFLLHLENISNLLNFIESPEINNYNSLIKKLLQIYVQDQIWKNREAIWRAVEDGANICVCGYALIFSNIIMLQYFLIL